MCELLGFADSASAFESRIVTAEGEVPAGRASAVFATWLT
jgi:hypothetical protein